jgi:hypothetical protein
MLAAPGGSGYSGGGGEKRALRASFRGTGVRAEAARRSLPVSIGTVGKDASFW